MIWPIEKCIYCHKTNPPCDMDVKGQPAHSECWAKRCGEWPKENVEVPQ